MLKLSLLQSAPTLIIEEANDIGTVVLRTDMYLNSVRQLLRANLKEYVEAQIAYNQVVLNPKKIVEYYLDHHKNIGTGNVKRFKIIPASFAKK